MLTNTVFDSGPTFFQATGGTSRIDYVALPLAARGSAASCATMRRQGRRVQLIADARPRDHRPVLVRLQWEIASTARGGGGGAIKWDDDLMARATQEGYGMPEFVTALLAECVESEAVLAEAEEEHGVDHHWCLVRDAVSRAAAPLFARRPGGRTDQEEEWRMLCSVRYCSAGRDGEYSRTYEGLICAFVFSHVLCDERQGCGALRIENRLQGEINVAWRNRRLAEVHRLCGWLAGRKLGPRRRKFGHLAAASRLRPSGRLGCGYREQKESFKLMFAATSRRS